MPVRWFMLAGWRLGLGLRLGSIRSPDHILGWHIAARHSDEILCQAESWFLDAHNAFHIGDGQLVWSTFISYTRPLARVVWPPVAVIHRQLVRRALQRAARPNSNKTSFS